MKNERPVMKSLKNFIAKRFGDEIQMFDCRNVVGDPMETVFYEDGVTVDYCYVYDYIEIFGLTDEEFDELNDQFGVDKKWRKRLAEALLKIEKEYEAFFDSLEEDKTCDTCKYNTAAFNPCNACKDKSEYEPQKRSK